MANRKNKNPLLDRLSNDQAAANAIAEKQNQDLALGKSNLTTLVNAALTTDPKAVNSLPLAFVQSALRENSFQREQVAEAIGGFLRGYHSKAGKKDINIAYVLTADQERMITDQFPEFNFVFLRSSAHTDHPFAAVKRVAEFEILISQVTKSQATHQYNGHNFSFDVIAVGENPVVIRNKKLSWHCDSALIDWKDQQRHAKWQADLYCQKVNREMAAYDQANPELYHRCLAQDCWRTAYALTFLHSSYDMNNDDFYKILSVKKSRLAVGVMLWDDKIVTAPADVRVHSDYGISFKKFLKDGTVYITFSFVRSFGVDYVHKLENYLFIMRNTVIRDPDGRAAYTIERTLRPGGSLFFEIRPIVDANVPPTVSYSTYITSPADTLVLTVWDWEMGSNNPIFSMKSRSVQISRRLYEDVRAYLATRIKDTFTVEAARKAINTFCQSVVVAGGAIRKGESMSSEDRAQLATIIYVRELEERWRQGQVLHHLVKDLKRAQSKKSFWARIVTSFAKRLGLDEASVERDPMTASFLQRWYDYTNYERKYPLELKSLVQEWTIETYIETYFKGIDHEDRRVMLEPGLDFSLAPAFLLEKYCPKFGETRKTLKSCMESAFVFHPRDIPIDGNCLYNSLLVALNIPSNTEGLKVRLAEHELLESISASTASDIENMLNDPVAMGDYRVLEFAAHALRFNACVHDRDQGNDAVYERFRVSPELPTVHLLLENNHYRPLLLDDYYRPPVPAAHSNIRSNVDRVDIDALPPTVHRDAADRSALFVPGECGVPVTNCIQVYGLLELIACMPTGRKRFTAFTTSSVIQAAARNLRFDELWSNSLPGLPPNWNVMPPAPLNHNAAQRWVLNAAETSVIFVDLVDINQSLPEIFACTAAHNYLVCLLRNDVGIADQVRGLFQMYRDIKCVMPRSQNLASKNRWFICSDHRRRLIAAADVPPASLERCLNASDRLTHRNYELFRRFVRDPMLTRKLKPDTIREVAKALFEPHTDGSGFGNLDSNQRWVDMLEDEDVDDDFDFADFIRDLIKEDGESGPLEMTDPLISLRPVLLDSKDYARIDEKRFEEVAEPDSETHQLVRNELLVRTLKIKPEEWQEPDTAALSRLILSKKDSILPAATRQFLACASAELIESWRVADRDTWRIADSFQREFFAAGKSTTSYMRTLKHRYSRWYLFANHQAVGHAYKLQDFAYGYILSGDQPELVEIASLRSRHEYILTGQATKVMSDGTLYERFRDVDLTAIDVADLRIRQSPAGGGKTTWVLQNAQKDDLFLTASNAARNDARQRADKMGYKINSNNILTVIGFLKNWKATVRVVYLDECFAQHPGVLLLVQHLTGAERIHCVGDQLQTNYHSGNALFPLRFSDWSQGGLPGFIREKSDVSYRIPQDICNILRPLYHRIGVNLQTTSEVRNSINLIRSNISAVRREPELTMAISSTEVSQLHGHATNTNTVKAAQGMDVDHSQYVRINTVTTNPAYQQESTALVALSRHKKKIDIIIPSNLTPKDDLLLKLVTGYGIGAGGGFGFFDHDLPTCYVEERFDQPEFLEMPTDIPVKVEQAAAYFDANVMNDGITTTFPTLFKPDVEPEPVFVCEEAQPEDLQELHDRWLPGHSAVDKEDWNEMIENTPLDVAMDDFSFNMIHLPGELPKHDTLTPLLQTSMEPRKPLTTKVELDATAKRNGSPVELSTIEDEAALAQLLYQRNCDVALTDPTPFPEIVPSQELLANWLAEQPEDTLEVDVDRLILAIESLSHWRLMIKRFSKPGLDLSAVTTVRKLQTICFKGPAYNALFAPIFTEIRRRMHLVLHPKIHFNVDLSETQFCERISNALNGEKLEELFNTELDISSFDNRQRRAHLLFDVLMLQHFGMPDALAEIWIASHEVTLLSDPQNSIKKQVTYQRKSGDPGTWWCNTWNATNCITTTEDPRDPNVVIVYVSGDDQGILKRDGYMPDDINETLAQVLNFDAKVVRSRAPYFCSRFLVTNGKKFVFITDPVKLLVKLGRRDLTNFSHRDQYYRSLLDTTNFMSQPSYWEPLAACVAERYSVPASPLDLATITGVVRDRSKFNRLFYARPGARLLKDVTKLADI